MTEPFTQWVIEEKFTAGRPDWEQGGALFVGNVAPYEHMKLRLLNGAHSAIAAIGRVAGLETVDQAIGHSVIRTFIEGYWTEAGATVSSELNPRAYTRKLLERFANSALGHRTEQIATDASQKVPQRILTPLKELRKKGLPNARLVFAVAAWIRSCAGYDDSGKAFILNDPMLTTWRGMPDQALCSAEETTSAFIGNSSVFGDELPRDTAFVHSVALDVDTLAHTDIAEHALDALAESRIKEVVVVGRRGPSQAAFTLPELLGLLLPIRKQFDLYANIRPHQLLPGISGPLVKSAFDILCIRENTEGEYSGAGGRVHIGTPHEVAVETSIFTRHAMERILRFGFEQARQRRKKLASTTKSNAQKFTMVLWDEITEELSAEYPDVEVTRYHIDALSARMITHPESLDVVVASNLFGDILTDMAGSDSSRSFFTGFGSSPSRCGPAVASHSGQSRGLPVPAQGASMHARVSDHAGLNRHSRCRTDSYCLPHTRRTSAPEKRQFRGSMAGLHAPLSTLHAQPHG